MFPERVKHKTCERHALTWTRLKDLTVLFYQTLVVLSGLIQGDLAATTADALAHGGAGTIIFTGHSQPELQPVIDHINRKHPQAKIIFITADPGSLASMAAAAKTIKALGVPIDGVVGFPTVMAASWEVTADGIESHFQRNYLGYFVLVNQLLETMPAGARVILMTTSIRREAPAPKWADVNFSVSLLLCWEDLYRSFLNLELLQNGESYHTLDGYAQSMFANILFSKSIAEKRLGQSIAAFSANPGSESFVSG